MKPLNQWQTRIFQAGALLLLAGLSMRLFLIPVSCWVVGSGVLMFTCMQMLMRYEGRDFVILRLRRQQLFSDFVFLLMAVFMIMQDTGTAPAWAAGNLWMLCLFIAAFLQIYTAFRIPMELKRKGE